MEDRLTLRSVTKSGIGGASERPYLFGYVRSKSNGARFNYRGKDQHDRWGYYYEGGVGAYRTDQANFDHNSENASTLQKLTWCEQYVHPYSACIYGL